MDGQYHGESVSGASGDPSPDIPLGSLRSTLDRLLDGEHLSEQQAFHLLGSLTDPGVPGALKGALLAALRAKGVTADELRGFATSMRANARRPALPSSDAVIDIVGTGGDHSGSLNLSTGSALLAASCGLPVVKHGNRSISSRSGSADVLQALGLPLPLDEAGAARCFKALGFTFLFAPYYHSAMGSIAAVRSALGVRTVFNLLGPLCNPASPAYLVVGAFSEQAAELMARALLGSGIRRAFVLHGAAGWDEATPIGEFTLFDVNPDGVHRERRAPADYGLPLCSAEDLAGGEARYNAEQLQHVLEGRSHGAHRNALLLGTALALEVSGRESSPRAALECAGNAIDRGAARELLSCLRRFGAEERRLGAYYESARGAL